MRKVLKNFEGFTQRNNKFNPSVACFPTSAAMALHYMGVDDPIDGLQLEDYIVKKSLNLSDIEKNMLVKKNGTWILNHRPFQVIPIMEYVCKKIYNGVFIDWYITFEEIIVEIDRGLPVVCLGNFKPLSYVSGHYNCIIGYDSEKKTVITMDPFGNAHTNYSDFNGKEMEYMWSIFCLKDNNFKASSGLFFSY